MRAILPILATLITSPAHAVTVAILDSGLNFSDPAFSNRLAGPGADFVENDDQPVDDTGHGTAIARLVIQAPVAVVLPVKVTDARSWSGASRVAAGIRYAVGQGAGIIILSLSSPSAGFAATIEPALREAEAAGTLIIAAAGNQGSDLALRPRYPAVFPLTNLITVAAIQHDGTLWPYSNFSPAHVHAAAYGGEAGMAPDVAQHFGTSLAAPRIAARAAVIAAAQPELTGIALRDAVLASLANAPVLETAVAGGRFLPPSAAM